MSGRRIYTIAAVAITVLLGLQIIPHHWVLKRLDKIFRFHPEVEVHHRTHISKHIGDVSTRAGLFTPYGITPGGGEKYFLSSALAYQRMGYEVDILVYRSNICDTMDKLENVAMSLRVPLDFSKLRFVRLHHVRESTWKALQYEAFFSISNSKFPQMTALGKRLNIWMCQFPFDLNNTDRGKREELTQRLAGYDVTLVNSVYSEYWYTAYIQPYLADLLEASRPFPTLEILYPPVESFIPMSELAVMRNAAQTTVLHIVVLGRFFRGRQSKGHDVALVVLEELMKRSSRSFHLTLLGNIHPTDESYAYVDELKRNVSSKGLPVTFVTNASPEDIRNSLSRATVMWHLTGMRKDENEDDPASKEHFGIAIAEAMGAGCVPIVTAVGGPSDIVTHGRNGYLAEDMDDYVTYTVSISELPEVKLKELSQRAVIRSQDFSLDRFTSRFAMLGHRSLAVSPYRDFAVKNVDLVRDINVVLSKQRELSVVIIEPSIKPLFEFTIRHVMRIVGPN